MHRIFLKIFLWAGCAVFLFFGFILSKKGFLSYDKYKKARNLEINISGLQKENEALKSEIEYFKNPVNLEKEARSVLNYKKSDEKLAIIIDDFKQPAENEKEKISEPEKNFWTRIFIKIKNLSVQIFN